VYRSTDDGMTWDTCTKIIRGDGAHSSTIFTMVEGESGAILVGMQPAPDSVVFASTDRGETWFSTGGLDGAYECLCLLRASDGTVFAGTTPNGDVFRYSPGGLEEDTPGSTRAGTGLSVSASGAAIRFFLPAAGTCELALYDNIGRKVAVILDEQRAAGNHRISWNRQDVGGHRVAVGSYVLRLTTQAGEASARMVLVD
jgi:hypothetical protein